MKISKDEKVIIGRILSLLKPYRKKIALILVCIMMTAGISILIPVISKGIMDDGLLAKNMAVIIKLSVLCLGVILLDQCIGIFETMNLAQINTLLPYSLSKKAFKHLLRLKIQYFNNTNFAEIMNNIDMDVSNISRISDKCMFFIVSGIFKMLGGLIGLMIINWKLAILVIVLIPIRFITVKYLAKKRMKLIEEYMEYNRAFSSWYGDTVSGVKEVKLWGLERIKTGQFIKKQRNIIRSNIRLLLMDKLNELSETVLYQVLESILYILGAWFILGNELTVGGLFAFITYSMYVTSPLFAILNIGYNFTSVLPSAKRLFNFFDMEVEEKKNSVPIQIIDKNNIRGAIVFENVSFSYRDNEQLLKNISFSIKAGEKVAIIGVNGVGKSTVINLLLRFLEPDEGIILIDGMDISKLKLRDYRSLISVVSQELYLFDTSIKENIAPKSQINDIEIYQAALESEARDFIQALPAKYDTMVGRNGSKLSGGERQKVATARALAKKSKILILDEATSNYDVESELQLNEFLKKKTDDKTILAITHKPHLLKIFDRIILLGRGVVQDTGSHLELMTRSAEYRNLVNSFEKDENKKVV